ncbi:MAG: cysteine desulfurase, partial [Actinobacteria bacterium]|nr:cysteine desulfurase [Actinomycetota bacterium]
MDYIYFDYAAATPVDAQVRQAIEPFFTEDFYNPSASYALAKAVRAELAAARTRIAHYLGVKGEELLFTAGGTEANNVVISGIMQKFSDSSCLIGALEHESVRQTAQQFNNQTLPVQKDGRVDITTLESCITDDTALVSCAYADSELGVIQPLAEIARCIRKIKKDRRQRGVSLPLYLHTDASQAANYLDVHVDKLGVDFMTLNGGKIYGPKQSGALYIRRPIVLEPFIKGGGQERNIRSGTENVAFAVGLSVALEVTQRMRQDEAPRLHELQQYMFTELESLGADIVINGSREHRLANNIHITIPMQHNERLLLELEQRGILAAAGSACSANKKQEVSSSLKAIGKSVEQAQSSIRITM